VPLALSTGHEVGLGVTAAVFIAFALASSFLFPRFRPQYPGGGLLAFVVISFVFFFGMLAAVEVFGVEEEHASGERVAETTTEPAPPTTTEQTTTEQGAIPPTSTQAATTTATETTVAEVKESEFKVVASKEFKPGQITFDVKNEGKLPHDLAVKGMPAKTKLIAPGGSATLTVRLKAGKYELYCTVPGHEAAGMKLNITVS
jgi:uncharacterized cupredoxin-like copper-binding protein